MRKLARLLLGTTLATPSQAFQLEVPRSYSDRWAVIVGISEYRDSRLDLKYAARDAQALYDLLLTPSGGGFEKDHVQLLLDGQATTANLQRALRSFLKKPREEDLVVLFFACHGSPDPERPKNVYLLTHDTEYDDISGTALPMDEIQRSIAANLHAERVVMLVDACHGAAISGQRDDRYAGGPLNRYLAELASTQEGIAILSSAEVNEVAREDEKWGGGHGVFTYFLLEAMAGKADGDPLDGTVTLGEIFEYVRERVRSETNDQQHPVIGTSAFDRRLPMAIRSGVAARDHLVAARHLLELGTKRSEPELFRLALRQFEEAARTARLQKSSVPEALVGQGRCLLLLRETERACAVLREALQQERGLETREALLLLGLALFQSGDGNGSASHFDAFAAQFPDDELAPLVALAGEEVRVDSAARRRALLIGIDRYDSLPPLRGPSNDVRILRDTLVEHARFNPADIQELSGHVLREQILEAFRALAAEAATGDVILVHFSGHSLNEGPFYLATSDTVIENRVPSTGISADDLHQLMMSVPSASKTLVLDTDGGSRFTSLASSQSNYAVIAACRESESSRELKAPEDGKMYGLLSYSFASVLERPSSSGYALESLLLLIQARMDKAWDQSQAQVLQHAQVLGRSGSPIFSSGSVALPALHLTLLPHLSEMPSEELNECSRKLSHRLSRPVPAVEAALARRFLEHEEYTQAAAALRRLGELDAPLSSSQAMALGLATACRGDFEGARVAMAGILRLESDVAARSVAEECTQLLGRAENNKGRALLVGIDDYQADGVFDIGGARDGVSKVKRMLVDRFGFEAERIAVLEDGAATRSSIDSEFKKLVAAAETQRAVFFFAGYGSTTSEHEPTIVSSDGRTKDLKDLELKYLAKEAEKAGGLVSIFDCQFRPGRRGLPADDSSKPMTRGIELLVDGGLETRERIPRVGSLSVFWPCLEDDSGWWQDEAVAKELSRESNSGAPSDGLLPRLMSATLEVSSSPSYQSLLAASGSPGLRPILLGAANRPWFSENPVARTIQDRLDRLETTRSSRAIVEHLGRAIEQREGHYPEGLLCKGVAYLMGGELEKSMESLEAALSVSGDQPIPRAHFWLGRTILVGRKNLGRAVSELRLAGEQDPEILGVDYYLGKAILDLIEAETKAEARQAFERYLERGAPIGHEEEVSKALAELPR